MAQPLFYPFKNLDFTHDTCFISGEKLSVASLLPVFPDWFMQLYHLQEKPFKLLDESLVTYADLKLPVDETIISNSINPFEENISKAFLNNYQGINQLSKTDLFLWIAKLVYGILHNEIRAGIRQQKALGEDFIFSQSLIHKFTNLHVMLQSLIRPVVFESAMPFSLFVFKVENEAGAFRYRDEINTLTFSLRAGDYGIIACLQDNGANAKYHDELLNKVISRPLHPVQFEELSARFFYSTYLFNRLPEYTVLTTEEAVYIEAMPLRGISNKPLFDTWDNKTYGKVLENFWKPWGYLLLEIIKDPENPMTFLTDEDGDFMLADRVDLKVSVK